MSNTFGNTLTTTLLFLDIDGVMCPFANLPDHWQQIFWRNFWTKIGRFDLVLPTISEEKRCLLHDFIKSIWWEVQVVISSDWRKTIPEDILTQAIWQNAVQKTPYTPRDIINPLEWKQWLHEATHKKELRLEQIRQFCGDYWKKIERIIVIDDSSVVPSWSEILWIPVEFIQPKSNIWLIEAHFS